MALNLALVERRSVCGISAGNRIWYSGIILQKLPGRKATLLCTTWSFQKVARCRASRYGAFFSIPFVGLNELGIPVFGNDKGDTSSAVYLQSDKTGFLKYEGPVDPIIVGGFTNTFTYKNLSLGFHISYQTGNKIRLYPAYRNTYSDLDATPNEFKNRWTLPGDEKLTTIPSIADLYTAYGISNASAYPYNNYNYSNLRVVDGSFVRLKSVTLRYGLPERVLQNTPFKTASASVIGNNLWLIYADENLHGQDPEFFNAGGVALPINKQFTFSLKLGF